jgi:hypothetical protein
VLVPELQTGAIAATTPPHQHHCTSTTAANAANAACAAPSQVDPELMGMPSEEEAASKRTRIKIEDPNADKKAQKSSGSSTG